MPAARTLKEQLLIPELAKIHQENYSVYDVYKIRYMMNLVGRDFI